MRKLLVALAILGSPICHAALTATEKNIADHIIKSEKKQQRFLKQLTNVQSGTLNVKGVRKVGEMVRQELDHLGFKTRWVKEPANMQRAGTLMATHTGNGSSQRILLIAHLDTVFSKSAPFHQYSQKKYSAKGQGVIDDKGGIAVLIYALKALHAAGELKNANIIIVLTGDEEDSGKPTSISRQPLIDVAKKSDVALDFEPAITMNTATIARRGITMWTITTHGNASHSATIFQKNVGVGAIFGLAHQLDEMRESLQLVKDLSFNPGIILGGSSVKYDNKIAAGVAVGKENIVANIAMTKGDLRYLDAAQKQVVEDKMRAIVAEKMPGITSKIEFVDGIPPMPPTQNNLKLLNTYSAVSIDLGDGKVVPLEPSVRGAGDISYVASYVKESLSGLGPIGLGPHTVIESIELASLVKQAQRAAILLFRLMKN